MEKGSNSERTDVVSLGQSRQKESRLDERLGASVHDFRSTNIIKALKKTEKLTMALYMVTDVLPDREPLKWQLRDGATKLLSEVALTATAGASDKFYLWGRAETRIDEIGALLDIAGITKMVSDMNANVLKKEYLGLKYQIAVERESVGGHGGVTLSDSFFAVDEGVPHGQLSLSDGLAWSEDGGGAEQNLPSFPEATAPTFSNKGQESSREELPAVTPKEVPPQLTVEKLEVLPITQNPSTNQTRVTELDVPERAVVEKVQSLERQEVARVQEVQTSEKISRETIPEHTAVTPLEEKVLADAPVLVRQNSPKEEVVPGDVVRFVPESSLKDLPVVTRPLASIIRPSVPTPERKPSLSTEGGEGRLSSSSRRQVILDLLHRKPDLSVRDLVDKIEGYSEKTIQRELLAMVSDGVLRKQGERRWSRYSLAR